MSREVMKTDARGAG